MPMRKMRAWIDSSLIAIILLTVGCSGDIVETTTSHYSNYKKAAEDGVVERGWLPRNLPDSAYDIIETHNIDTNELWVKFQFSQTDINSFLSQCAETANLRLPSARTRIIATWWPETLTDRGGERLPSTMQMYRCSKMPHAQSEFDASVVLDAQEQIAWYWIDP